MSSIKRDSALRKRMKEIKKNGLAFNLIAIIPIIWATILLGVILWGVMVAFAEPNWYLSNSNTIFIKEFTLGNFRDGFEKFKLEISNPITGLTRTVGYLEMTINSLWFAVGCAFMQIMATVCFAYAVARFEFVGRKFLHGFVIVQLMLPLYGQMAANVELLTKLGLMDSPLFLLSMGAGHGMYFLVSYSFFRNLPSGYEEAAKIDGAGPFTIFGRIMLPLCKSLIIAYFIMLFIGHWGNYANVIVYLPSYPTLSSALFLVKERAFAMGLQTPQYFAMIIISSLPATVLYLIFNKTISENMSLGGLKG